MFSLRFIGPGVVQLDQVQVSSTSCLTDTQRVCGQTGGWHPFVFSEEVHRPQRHGQGNTTKARKAKVSRVIERTGTSVPSTSMAN